MNEKPITSLPIFLLLFSCAVTAQNNPQMIGTKGGAYPLENNDVQHPCITSDQYALIEKRIADNIVKYHIKTAQQDALLPVPLSWPLKAASGFNDCSFYTITAYVDENAAAGSITDYHCGTNTYDGHKGTDIATYPFGFYKMDNSQVEVIAAAPGTILDRSDGNFDRNCATNNLTANYIAIQHANGSVALYFHMKKNSVTAKTVGQTVAVGEYLGIVGSSGNATGPHLHFEVWSGSTSATYNDPYSGTCNTLNASSWWITQKPYTEPAIIKASVHITDAVFPGCPNTETPNESTCYALPFQGPGLSPGTAKFYIFFRDETAGMVGNLSILNPDGSSFASWTYTSNNSYNASYRSYTKTLPTTAGTYTFKAVYNGITCSQTFDIMKATVTPNGPTAICQGSSVMLSANAGSAYLWSNGDTTQNITVSTAGNYAVTVTNGNGCSASSTATAVTVNPLPVASITAGGPTTFCQGGSVHLTAGAASSYLWSTGATTAGITVSASGNYNVTVTNANGCSASSTATAVTVNPLPVASITAGGPTVFCQGGSVQLTANNASSYLWSTGATTAGITVSASGNYNVTVTNANGCSASSTATAVTVNPLPVASITAGGPTVFCQGGSVQLTANDAGSYLWSTGATTAGITVSASGNYNVTVTNANGCSASSTATAVTVNPLPVASITAGGPTTFCQGGSVQLTAGAASSYLWSTGATTAGITVSASGNYNVTVTNANGCSASSTATAVTVNPLPAASITAGGPTTFCQGGSVQLTANNAGSYLWSTGATTAGITVSASGNYNVTVTNANGCSASSTATAVTVNPLPAASITAGGPTVFCQGGSVQLTATNASSYLWSTGATTAGITVSASGNYNVTITNSDGCTGSSSGIVISVNTPQNGLAILFNQDTLTAPYQLPVYWYQVGNPVPVDSGLIHQCGQTGDYYAVGLDLNGCTATSGTLHVSCNATGIHTAMNLSGIQAYPNPTDGTFRIAGSGVENGLYSFTLKSVTGQNLSRETLLVEDNTIQKAFSLTGLPEGVYFLAVQKGTAEIEMKVIKI